jgi:hypothetical protein
VRGIREHDTHEHVVRVKASVVFEESRHGVIAISAIADSGGESSLFESDAVPEARHMPTRKEEPSP